MKYRITGYNGHVYGTQEAAAKVITDAVAYAGGHIVDFDFDFAKDVSVIRVHARDQLVAYSIEPVDKV